MSSTLTRPLALWVTAMALSTTTVAVRADAPIQVDDAQMKQWAKFYALQLYDWQPDLIQNHLAKLAHYFTPQAWDAYTSALKDSKFIDQIRHFNLRISASTSGPMRMTPSEIAVPVTVRYENRTHQYQQDILINMKITPTHPLPYSISALQIKLMKQYASENKTKRCPNKMHDLTIKTRT